MGCHLKACIILAAGAGFLLVGTAEAAKGAGSTSANFLKIGMGARAAGMGDAFVGVADDATATYWNPAGLSLTRGVNIHTTHAEWMEGVNHEFLGFSHRLGRDGCVGASFTYLGTGTFRGTLETPSGDYGGPGFDISASDFAGTAAYSQRLGLWIPGPFFRKTLVGVKATVVGQKALAQMGYGFSMDLGFMYEAVRKKMYVGLVATNVGTKVEDHSQPTVFKLGFGYKPRRLLMKKDRAAFSVQTDAHMDTGIKPDLGAEYVAGFGRNEVAFRTGYRMGYELGGMSGLTTGAGIGHQFSGTKADLNYAFAPYGDLGMTHRVSLDLQFGGLPLPPQPLVDCPPQFTLGEGQLKISMNTKSEEPIVRWKLVVHDAAMRPLRTFEGKGQPPRRSLWDGRDEKGTYVPEGDYFLKMEVADAEEGAGVSKPKGFKVKTVKRLQFQYGFQFSGDLLFDSGRAELMPRAHAAIGKAVSIIEKKYPEAYIAIYGHTDSQRLSKNAKFKSNDELSVARAQAVKDYVASTGVNPAKLFVKGFGETRPVRPNDNAVNMSENRRVELVVFGEKTLTPAEIIGEGIVLFNAGRYREALDQFLKTLQADSSSAKAYRMAGRCYFQLKDEEKGLRAFKRALELDPDDEKLSAWIGTYEKTKGTPAPPLELEAPGSYVPNLAPAAKSPQAVMEEGLPPGVVLPRQ
jgi:flagellar motor protein MotB